MYFMHLDFIQQAKEWISTENSYFACQWNYLLFSKYVGLAHLNIFKKGV